MDSCFLVCDFASFEESAYVSKLHAVFVFTLDDYSVLKLEATPFSETLLPTYKL